MRYLICAALVVAAAPAFGQTPDWDRCRNVTDASATEQNSAACTRILNDRSEAGNHAMALRNRCAIWITKADYDRAIVDCNKAIEMEPQSSIAFDRRGQIMAAKGELDRALADFSESIRLEPKQANAYLHRSQIYRHRGDTARADADRAEAIRLNPSLAHD
jgi:tetratricopeptide (TPR) repeat protein